MSDTEGPGFVIHDRRGVEPDDGERADAEQSSASPTDQPRDAAEGPPAHEMPAIDFSTFILSLSTSALVHLGEGPATDGTTEKNLPMARQVIDIIALLQQKTAGNVTTEEEQLLEQLLYDLRLRYVNAAG